NIKYLAKVSGTSCSTVSRALRGDPTANKETAEKILKIAGELNYYPNMLAKGLRNKKTKTIGIILNDLKNPLYYETIKVIEETLNDLDYTMLLCDSNFDLDLERKNIITMLSKGVDGIIISPINIKSENIELIRSQGLKAVYIDFAPEIDNINYVHVSHASAAFIATEYLIKRGHTKILVLNGPEQLSVSKDFYKGYARSMSKHGILINKALVKYIGTSIEGGNMAISQLYPLRQPGQNNDFTAVLCVSDMLAIGVYEASKELGFKIPDDLSVVGYDNIFMTAYLAPPLTTIHAPKIRIGEFGIKILLDQIEEKNREYHKIILDVKLVERESVKTIN
ncbi:MAG: LacI family DNA-binding transcriptional regulator, partial [Actinobacteria bacterium]|nr:LacI family DNA-binding transcriptional regulator [Actinomycetota bacterium]